MGGSKEGSAEGDCVSSLLLIAGCPVVDCVSSSYEPANGLRLVHQEQGVDIHHPTVAIKARNVLPAPAEFAEVSQVPDAVLNLADPKAGLRGNCLLGRVGLLPPFVGVFSNGDQNQSVVMAGLRMAKDPPDGLPAHAAPSALFFRARAFALWSASRVKQAFRAASARRLLSAGGSRRSGSTSSSNRLRNAARAGFVVSRGSWREWSV
jgi:hypothetical protein